MPAIFALLKAAGLFSPAKLIGGAILVVLLGTVATQTYRLKAAEVELLAAKNEAVIYHAHNDELGVQLSAQNSAITALQAQGAALSLALDNAQNRAKWAEAAADAAVTVIKNTPVPKDCAGAEKWLAGKGRDQSQDWKSR